MACNYMWNQHAQYILSLWPPPVSFQRHYSQNYTITDYYYLKESPNNPIFPSFPTYYVHKNGVHFKGYLLTLTPTVYDVHYFPSVCDCTPKEYDDSVLRTYSQKTQIAFSKLHEQNKKTMSQDNKSNNYCDYVQFEEKLRIFEPQQDASRVQDGTQRNRQCVNIYSGQSSSKKAEHMGANNYGPSRNSSEKLHPDKPFYDKNQEKNRTDLQHHQNINKTTANKQRNSQHNTMQRYGIQNTTDYQQQIGCGTIIQNRRQLKENTLEGRSANLTISRNAILNQRSPTAYSRQLSKEGEDKKILISQFDKTIEKINKSNYNVKSEGLISGKTAYFENIIASTSASNVTRIDSQFPFREEEQGINNPKTEFQIIKSNKDETVKYNKNDNPKNFDDIINKIIEEMKGLKNKVDATKTIMSVCSKLEDIKEMQNKQQKPKDKTAFHLQFKTIGTQIDLPDKEIKHCCNCINMQHNSLISCLNLGGQQKLSEESFKNIIDNNINTEKQGKHQNVSKLNKKTQTDIDIWQETSKHKYKNDEAIGVNQEVERGINILTGDVTRQEILRQNLSNNKEVTNKHQQGINHDFGHQAIQYKKEPPYKIENHKTGQDAIEERVVGDIQAALNKIVELRNIVKLCEKEVDIFEGTTKDQKYIDLDKMLVEIFYKIENLNTENDLGVRTKKAECMKYTKIVLTQLQKKVFTDIDYKSSGFDSIQNENKRKSIEPRDNGIKNNEFKLEDTSNRCQENNQVTGEIFEEQNIKKNAIDKIKELKVKAEKLVRVVKDFEGTTEDKRYIYLDEMFQRVILELESIQTEYDLCIQRNKEECIKYSYAGLKMLEEKAFLYFDYTSDGTNDGYDKEIQNDNISEVNGQNKSTKENKIENNNKSIENKMPMNEENRSKIDDYESGKRCEEHVEEKSFEDKEYIEKIQIALKQIEELKNNAMMLVVEVESSEGTIKNEQYIYLEEMLTRLLLKLDNVETENVCVVREKRRECIIYTKNGLTMLRKKHIC